MGRQLVVVFISVASISVIGFHTWSAYNAITQGKLRERLQRYACHAVAIILGTSVLGVAMAIMVGFIMCCVAMSTEEGPNLLETISFVAFISVASMSFIGVVTRSAYKAIAQSKLCERFQRCACHAV